MAELQKALWMVDEVEARWQSLLKQYPQLERVEVFWGRAFEGSMEAAVGRVAMAIGVRPPMKPPEHTRVHAGAYSESAHRDIKLYRLDREYREMMQFNYLPG